MNHFKPYTLDQKRAANAFMDFGLYINQSSKEENKP